MTACVSLFRAINVGGRTVKMEQLKAMHTALGFENVSPYIQSGNVMFTCEDTDTTDIQKRIQEHFKATFGFHSDVFVRTASELQAIIENNPFQGREGIESKWLVVQFLAAHPDEAAQESLRSTYNGPEEIFVIGKEAYIYYPTGIGTSKLTNTLLERKLKTVGTARNLNTLLQLRKRMV